MQLFSSDERIQPGTMFCKIINDSTIFSFGFYNVIQLTLAVFLYLYKKMNCFEKGDKF